MFSDTLKNQLHILICNYVQRLRIKGFPGGTSGKESACQCKRTRDKVSIPGSGRPCGVGDGNPLHYSRLENSMGGGTCQAIQSMRLQDEAPCLVFCVFCLLIAPGLCFSMQNLLIVACGSQFPDQGLNLGCLHWVFLLVMGYNRSHIES